MSTSAINYGIRVNSGDVIFPSSSIASTSVINYSIGIWKLQTINSLQTNTQLVMRLDDHSTFIKPILNWLKNLKNLGFDTPCALSQIFCLKSGVCMSDFPRGGDVRDTRAWLDKKGYTGLFMGWDADALLAVEKNYILRLVEDEDEGYKLCGLLSTARNTAGNVTYRLTFSYAFMCVYIFISTPCDSIYIFHITH